MSRIPDDVRIAERKSQTIQTHNNVNVSPSAGADSNWFSCDGYDKLNINMQNDAVTTSRAHVFFSKNGADVHGAVMNALPNGTERYRSIEVPVSLAFFKLQMVNGDAAAHNMSADVYLKG